MCLGIPGRVVAINDNGGLLMGTVDFAGTTREVCLAYLANDIQVGDYALVHVGFAIAKVDEEEARRTFEALSAMSQLDELDWLKEVADQGLGGHVKYLDEYRDPAIARGLVERIRATSTRSWALMEVCGGQTHTLVRQGIPELLAGSVELIHGPGCPVCVTPLEQIDRALSLASRPDVILTSFGDMLRVPGSECDLQAIRARGGNVRVVYSPLDALELAKNNPDKQVVFFAVGFETTAPANAMSVWEAHRRGIPNFSLLVSHVTVPPAMEAILSAPESRVQGFLAAGHVCTVMGYTEYEPIAATWQVPIVVTGFEPVDLLEGILMCVTQLEEGRHEVENQYARVVTRSGTVPARTLVQQVFELGDRKWRGIGTIPMSGLRLKPEFANYDAEIRFGLSDIVADEPAECRAGDVLTGRIKPTACPMFGTVCTPTTPLGAPMVSGEGACAAYWQFGHGRLDSAHLTADVV